MFDDVSTLIRPFDMPKLVQNALKVRFATNPLNREFEEFRNACGKIFVERFKGILSNHLNISKLPQSVKDDLRERIFPLGLTLQLMKMSKLKTLEAQIKYFGGNMILLIFFLIQTLLNILDPFVYFFDSRSPSRQKQSFFI